MATKKNKEATWSKAQKIKGKNPDVYRKDVQGNIMYKSSYGKNSKFGWEIDHKNPKANGGTNHPKNLQALNSKANKQKADKYPYKK